MRTVRSLIHQGTDILRNDSQHRRLQRAFHIVDGLDARIQIFDEERQTDADGQADHDSQRDVHRLVWPDRAQPGLRRIDHVHDSGLGNRCVNAFLDNAQPKTFPHNLRIFQIALGLEIRTAGNGSGVVIGPGAVDQDLHLLHASFE